MRAQIRAHTWNLSWNKDGYPRGSIPKIQGLWFQKPLRAWFLGPESLNTGNLDPLGMVFHGNGAVPISAESPCHSVPRGSNVVSAWVVDYNP